MTSGYKMKEKSVLTTPLCDLVLRSSFTTPKPGRFKKTRECVSRNQVGDEANKSNTRRFIKRRSFDVLGHMLILSHKLDKKKSPTKR